VLSLTGLAIIVVTVMLVQRVSLRPPNSHASIPPKEGRLPPVPNIPSIAVLPFLNLSNDLQQEYFSDGLTEDLITDLSKVPGLFVIARNSVFTFKGKPESIEQIGRELGVRYLVEGSARKADGQVRITAQLIDATTGYHIWAEHYDRPLNNIFRVQDEIRQKIVFALEVRLSREEQERFKDFPTSNMDAYDLFLRGRAKILDYTRQSNRQARDLCEKAAALDPRYSAAYMCIALTYVTEWTAYWNTDPKIVDEALAFAQQAVHLDHFSPMAYAVLGDVYKMRKQLHEAIAVGEKSIALGPSCSWCFGDLAEHMLWCYGGVPEASKLLEKALRLEPTYYRADYQVDVASIHWASGNTGQAIDEMKQVIAHQPTFAEAHAQLAEFYANMGDEREARMEAAIWLKLIRPLTIARVKELNILEAPCIASEISGAIVLDTLQRLTTTIDHGSLTRPKPGTVR